jgi:ribosomal protein L37E
VTAVLDTPALTAAERCDRCGAQAYVRVLLASGGELLFCAHHGREHADKLREVAVEIHDESSRLSATPARAADAER